MHSCTPPIICRSSRGDNIHNGGDHIDQILQDDIRINSLRSQAELMQKYGSLEQVVGESLDILPETMKKF